MTTETLNHWRRHARQKLAVAPNVPRRYGTAFHLTPPVESVEDLPIRQFTSKAIFSRHVSSALGQAVTSTHDPYLLWHVAHSDQLPVNHIVVASGTSIQRTIHTRGTHASAVTVIEVKPNAACTIVDTSLDHTMAICRTIVRVHEGASFTYWVLRAGNAFMTESVEVTLAGRGAVANVNHVVLDGGTTQADVHVHVNHTAPDTTSRVTARLAGYAQAQAMYRGKITVAPTARGSNGYQQARALLLSPKAVIDVLPELAINTNDVKCSHGVTTLHLDEASLFYLRSRGISESDARQLALKGFFHQDLALPATLAKLLDRRVMTVHTE
jgi:Fe-S cluster assembly protein SufD